MSTPQEILQSFSSDEQPIQKCHVKYLHGRRAILGDLWLTNRGLVFLSGRPGKKQTRVHSYDFTDITETRVEQEGSILVRWLLKVEVGTDSGAAKFSYASTREAVHWLRDVVQRNKDWVEAIRAIEEKVFSVGKPKLSINMVETVEAAREVISKYPELFPRERFNSDEKIEGWLMGLLGQLMSRVDIKDVLVRSEADGVPASMFCWSCGRRMPAEAKFCGCCGISLLPKGLKGEATTNQANGSRIQTIEGY